MNPNVLREALMERLDLKLDGKGFEDGRDRERVSDLLNVLLANYPEYLRNAQKAAFAAAAEVRDAEEEIPAHIESDEPLPISRCNV